MQLAADAIALELAPATISRFNVIQCHMGYFELWNNFIEDFYKMFEDAQKEENGSS